MLWFAEDGDCEDRKIAVGRTLPEQQNAAIDWIFPRSLGEGPHYYRNPYDADCELDLDVRFNADELTRPHDPGPRAERLRPGEGYYLDLVDDARSGPPVGRAVTTPVYAERTGEGDGGIRLSYWVLFGRYGGAGEPDAHEGEWERVDVVLQADGDRYEPLEVQVSDSPSGGVDGATFFDGVRETPWAAARRVSGTHPVVALARATHTPTVATAGDSCAGCVPWPAWRSLRRARDQLWYGFGGAWGEPGTTSATTGSLGPHGYWPSGDTDD